MDILIEILLDIYMECMFLIVPEDKRSKRHYVLATVVAIVATLGILALGVWGIVWIVEYKRLWGWVPLVVAIVLSVGQIVCGILLHAKKSKKKQTEKEV